MKQHQATLKGLTLSFILGATTTSCYASISLSALENMEGPSVELSCRGIDNNGAQALARNTTLTSLDLRYNGVGAAGAEALARNTTLTSLDLTNNQVGDAGAQALARNTTLTSLDLEHNQVGDAGAQALARNTTLTSLNLGGGFFRSNPIGDAGAEALARNTTLTSLNLWYNQVKVAGAQALACNTTLTSLNLWGNQVRDAGAEALARNTTLTSLNLEGNGVRAAGAQALARNTTLTSLNLKRNKVGDAGAEALARNTTLTSLDLGGHGFKINPIGDAGAEALARNTTLTSLNLEGNEIGAAGTEAFLTALRTQTNLISLWMDWSSDTQRSEAERLLKRNQGLANNHPQPAVLPQPPQAPSSQAVIAPALTDKPIQGASPRPSPSSFSFGLPSSPQALTNEPSKSTPAAHALSLPLEDFQGRVKQLEKEKAQIEETLSTVMLSHGQLLERQNRLVSSYAQIFNLLQELEQGANPLIHMALGLSYKHELVSSTRPSVALDYFFKALAQGEKRALPLIQEAADEGDSEAQYLVGQAYEQGHGVAKDLEQSLTWYRKAAAQQHNLAQGRLTALQDNLLELAAQQGDRQAQYKLGLAYYQRRAVPHALQTALTWLTKAADQDHPEALLMLADLYYQGQGVTPNVSEAIKLYQRALLHNKEDALQALKAIAVLNTGAQYALGEVYEKGQGTQADMNQALQWYHSAAQHHHGRALYALGRLSAEGIGQPLATGRDIIQVYEQSLSFYTQAHEQGITEAAESISRIQQTLKGLHAIKEPEIKRNLLLRKLQQSLSSPLAPDLLYYSAHLTGVIRLAFTEGPQEALMQALHGIAQFPPRSEQARAIMQVLLNLIEADEFHDNALGENEDAFRLSELGRICRGIYSLQTCTELISPSKLPAALKVTPEGLKDVRIEVFNCLFRTPQVPCDWAAFDQMIERLLQQFDQGIHSGKITREMLYDDEFDQQADRTNLKDLLQGVKVGRPSERFAHRMLKIESLLMHKLDESSRYAQLASWAIAGIHCGTRAEKETYDFYHRHMTDTQSMDQEEAGLEMRLALTLADLRKSLVSELVPLNENERIHQVAHLEKKATQCLALVGDAQEFEDRYQMVVKSQYKAMSSESILALIKQKYTPEKMAEYVMQEINKREGSRLSYMVLSKAFEQRQSLTQLSAFYDEDLTSFTLEGAKALLYSTGYLEGK